ncbi:MAG TPA: single-stranded DNA-binding protein [Atribacteraceae bacterium]|nr:single-stranded DNA-binding protein [Atribacteraceae bacterium]
MARGDMNYFFGIGRLARDPDLRYTPQGTAVCKFTLAMGRQYQGKNGMVDETTFITVTAWSKLGENCARFLQKGRQVAVVGELRSNPWEDREGNRRTSYEINAANVQFLSPPRQGTGERNTVVSEGRGSGVDVEPFTFQNGGDHDNALGNLEDIPPDDNDNVAPF